MALKVIDAIKEKKPKAYEETVQVDELDERGLPTGRKTEVPKVAYFNVYQDRERWLDGRLVELEIEEIDELDASGNPTGRKLKASQVRVQRGSLDDVIGIHITYEVVA